MHENVYGEPVLNLETEEIMDLVEEMEADLRAYIKSGNISLADATREEIKALKRKL